MVEILATKILQLNTVVLFLQQSSQFLFPRYHKYFFPIRSLYSGSIQTLSSPFYYHHVYTFYLFQVSFLVNIVYPTSVPAREPLFYYRIVIWGLQLFLSFPIFTSLHISLVFKNIYLNPLYIFYHLFLFQSTLSFHFCYQVFKFLNLLYFVFFVISILILSQFNHRFLLLQIYFICIIYSHILVSKNSSDLLVFCTTLVLIFSWFLLAFLIKQQIAKISAHTFQFQIIYHFDVIRFQFICSQPTSGQFVYTFYHICYVFCQLHIFVTVSIYPHVFLLLSNCCQILVSIITPFLCTQFVSFLG